MKKSCIALAVLLSPLTGVCNKVLPIYSAEVLGRDLDSPVGKQFGHVGITMSPSLGQIATFQIEVLNDQNRVVQVNWMNDFKGRSPYWGSRYGIADQNSRTILVLREANSQRCLRSKYTLTTFF